MARLSGLLLSDDESFRTRVAGLLRSGAIPIGVSEERSLRDGGSSPDLVVVDARGDESTALATIEKLRGRASSMSILVVAVEAKADLIIRAMRVGANEFLTWPVQEDTFHDAIRRIAARHELLPATRKQATTLAFFGAKGGAGVTTVAVNCGVELARLSKRPTVIVDLKPGLGEVTLFLGVRSRYTLVDAVDNLHRLDEQFLRELVSKHKSGLEILAGSNNFDRPSPADSGAIEEVFRLLGRQNDYILVDAGSQLNACAISTLYGADVIYLVANPDVPSIRNAQRLLDRIAQLGAAGDRVRILLNRAAEPFPIPLSQIESALGRPVDHMFPSDYKTVSAALNTGVPLALTGNSSIAAQFDRFTRLILDPKDAPPLAAPARGLLGLPRIASLW
jgi:pilus assembly protein CpaE